MVGFLRLKASLILFLRSKSSKLPEACSIVNEIDIQDTGTVPGNVTTLDEISNQSSGDTLYKPISHSQNPVQFANHFQREDKVQRERDLKRLAMAFILAENRDLKDAVIMTSRVANIQFKNSASITAKMTRLASLFGSLVIGISETSGTMFELSETTEMAEYLSSLCQLETQLRALNAADNLNDAQQHTINGMLSHLIDKVEAINARNPAITNVQIVENIDSRQRLDSVIDSSITILTIAKDACSFAPPAFVKTSVSLACGLMKAVKKTRSNYEDMQEMSVIAAEFVLSLVVLVTESKISISEGLENALKDFTSTLKDIVMSCQNLSKKSLAMRFLQQGDDGDNILRLKDSLQAAIQKFQMKAQMLQSADFHSFSKIVIDKMDGDVIRSLPDNEFFEGCRDDFFPTIHDNVLTQIGTWIEKPSCPVLWLCGSAGMGKSSIAHQLVYHLIDAGRLGAQMFFTRGSDMQRNLVTVIHTLARELASTHPKSIPEIANAIRLGSSKHQELSVYLKKHVVAPIQSLSLSHPLVIILDALDECKHSNLLLKAISEISDLSGIKILVTSRPEPQIANAMSTIGAGVQKINLQRLSDTKMEQYISSRFAKIIWHDQQPSEKDLSDMAKLSSGLIIYAATACNFLGNEMQQDEAYQLLQKIVTCSKSQDIAAEHQLASLYHATLSHLFKGKDIVSFHQVFHPMSVVQDSMTVKIFAKTFKLGVRQTKAIHSALVSLQIYDAADSDTILPATQRFHSSFLDYIAHSDLKSLSNEFHVDPFLAHSTASQRCLSQLRDFMTIPGNQVPASYYDLERPIRYAVCHWPFHLTEATPRDSTSSLHDDHHFSLKQLMEDGMPLWTPFYLLASQAFTTALEGIGSRKAVDRAIIFHTRSLQLFEASGLDPSQALSDFGFALWKRYEQSGFLEDLEQAISMHSKFLELPSPPIHSRAQALSRLGIAFQAHFLSPNRCDGDLDNSIKTLREALDIYSSLGTEDFHALLALTSSVRRRFEATGDSGDLDLAISMIRRAITLPNIDHFDQTRAQNNLATCLMSRFENSIVISDLDQATELLKKILESRPVGHPHRASTLNNLALCLRYRFDATGSLEHLQTALEMHREVLVLRPAPHRYRDQTLVNIAHCLCHRFEKQGSMADIEEAICMDLMALELRPPRSPFHATSLNRLGCDFFARFQTTGDDADLDEAILLLSRAVDHLPSHEREYPEFLECLAEALRSRFELGSVQKDLDDSVAMREKALTLCNLGTSTYCISLIGLASALLTSYRHAKSEELLQTIDSITKKALPLSPLSHCYSLQARHNRAQALHYMARQTHRQQDLDDAYGLYDDSLRLCTPGHYFRPITLEGFAHVLHDRFEQTNSPGDLSRCISLLKELATIVSFSRPRYRNSVEMLVNALKTRFDQAGDNEDLTEASRISLLYKV